MTVASARRSFWGLLGFIGYMLSPFSPWNDAFVNIPIAGAVAGAAALLGGDWRAWFVIGYVASNALGVLLMVLAAGRGFKLYSGRAVALSLLGSRLTGRLHCILGSNRSCNKGFRGVRARV